MTYHRIVDISNKMGVASRAGIVQSSGSSDFTSVVNVDWFYNKQNIIVVIYETGVTDNQVIIEIVKLYK
jgi:hypothetical protein